MTNAVTGKTNFTIKMDRSTRGPLGGVFSGTFSKFVIEAEVKVYELLGAEVFLYCDFEQTQITARVNPRTNLRSGDKAVFALDLEKIHLFDNFINLNIRYIQNSAYISY